MKTADFEEKKYFCTESERSFTESELKEMYLETIESGDTYAIETYEDYKKSCMYENNGTLVEVKELYSISVKGKVVFSVSNIKTDLC